jgi:hypothetical protein
MKTNTSIERLEREIVTIKQNLLRLGPMHPGSVSQQFQVCGRKECRCMDPQKPERHGPYYKLAYVYRGKPVCRFVRAACVDNMKIRLAVYKQFRSLMDKWIKLSIQRGKLEFFATAPKTKIRKG